MRGSLVGEERRDFLSTLVRRRYVFPGPLLARYIVQVAEALRLEEMKKKPELVKVYGVAPVRRPR